MITNRKWVAAEAPTLDLFISHMVIAIRKEVCKITILSFLFLVGCSASHGPIERLQEVLSTPTISCYDDATSPMMITACAFLIAEETKNKLHKLINRINFTYFSGSPNDSNVFLRVQSEFMDLEERECLALYNRYSVDPDYPWVVYSEYGYNSSACVSSCLTKAYEYRIQELE